MARSLDCALVKPNKAGWDSDVYPTTRAGNGTQFGGGEGANLYIIVAMDILGQRYSQFDGIFFFWFVCVCFLGVMCVDADTNVVF